MKTKLLILILAAGTLAACSSAVTAEKMGRVHAGMKAAEVEALLGAPAQIEQAETTGLRGQVYDYPAPNGQGRVIFLNDAVFKAEFVAGGKKS